MAPKTCSIAPWSNTDNALFGRSLLKISNNKTKRKKMQNYVKLVFFRKKFMSKDIKAIKYKMKKLYRFVNSSKESPWDLQLSRICLTSTKRTSNMTKIKNSFFLWKTRKEASKVITNSFKKTDFVAPIPFDTFPWQK